jgi:hypothetical protein
MRSRGSCTDRPNSGASLEVLVPTALPGRAALSEAASHRTIPLQRFSRSRAGDLSPCFPGIGLRSCGFPPGKLARAVLSPSQPSARSRVSSALAAVADHASLFSCFFGDVPLSAIGSHGLIGPGTGTCLRWTDGAPGIVPFAVLLLPAGGSSALARRRAHVPFA